MYDVLHIYTYGDELMGVEERNNHKIVPLLFNGYDDDVA